MRPQPYRKFVQTTLDELGPLPELLTLIERTNPLFTIVPTSLLDIFCNEVLWACDLTRTPCLALQSGWDNLSSKGIIHHQPAFLGVWGPQSARHASEIQSVATEKCAPLGAPHYDLLQEAPEFWRRQFRASIGVAPEGRLVLFGGSFRQFDETDILRRLDDSIERGELGRIKVVYRPHPWRADRQSEDNFFELSWRHIVFDPDMKARYLRAKQDPGFLKRHNPIFDMTYLGHLISSVDAVISPMSTLLLEAMLMQKPTMAIAFSDGKHAHNPSVTAQMTHFRELFKSRTIEWCADLDRFLAQCRDLLGVGGERAGGDYKCVLHDLIVNDGRRYPDRLAEYCHSMIAPRARVDRQVRAAQRRETISHAYGAHLIAREYCALEDATAKVPGYWMHGWIPSYHNAHYALIALHKKPGQSKGYDYIRQIEHEKVHVDQWVSREDQAEFLRAQGYERVRAIGLPFVYIPELSVRRRPGSLLVMPPHAHRSHGVGDPLADEYASLIADMRRDFAEIWVCLNEDDYAKGEWVHSFTKRGIKVFVGSDQADPYTHLRLKRILSAFEFVTTNGFGSHIAYAAYCGAKVSVFGPYAAWPRERMARTHAVQMFPELVDEALELCSEHALRSHYPWLFTEPKLASVRRDWAQRELGADRRCSRDEIRRLFGWEKGAPA
jgi:hypothetical protein